MGLNLWGMTSLELELGRDLAWNVGRKEGERNIHVSGSRDAKLLNN